MKEIYLIRHTAPKVESGVCYGISDLDVVESFEHEAEAIKTALLEKSIETIYSSPLLRCCKLASHLRPNQKILLDDRLKELDFGDWEMKPWAGIDRNEMNKWSADFVNIPTPNGESFGQLCKKVSAFVDEEIQKNKASKIAVVTHSGVIRCLVSRYLYIPLNKVFRLKLDYGVVVKLTLHDGFEEVEFIR